MGKFSQNNGLSFATMLCYAIQEVMEMNRKLWTRNFTLLMAATTLGAAGGIAGGFALSFLVFDETGSTLAAALTAAIQLIPTFLVPLIAAPWMDRVPRKPVLVGGDVAAGILYSLMGLYLLRRPFSYTGYLLFSLLISTLGVFDELSYGSIYPRLIPKGMEEKGFAVTTTLYPVLRVVMMPLAALLLDSVGVAWLLVFQGGLCLLAALVENQIRLEEVCRPADSGESALKVWLEDIREAVRYLKKEKGLQRIYGYMAVTNGLGNSYSPILVAFFRTFPGMTAAMYSFFSMAEFLGRTLGGVAQYAKEVPAKKKFGFTFFVYQTYELMDMCLLWLPYPLMLVNRALCGFLGANSATMRQAAVQRHIPDHLRARINAFESMLYTASYSVFSLAVGALGEIMDYRLCVTFCGFVALTASWLLIWGGRRHVRPLFE